MDEFEARLEKMFGPYKKSRQFQEHCWELYRKHKEEITELVRWRTLLHIKPASHADGAIAFLIERAKKLRGRGWKSVVDEIMRKIVELPPGMWETYLQAIVRRHEQQLIDELLKGEGKRYHPVDVLQRKRREIEEYLETLERFMKQGRIAMLTAPPAEYLPDWFFIARPENEFYQNEKLEYAIIPLIEHEKAEENEKARILNKLNALLEKHTWRAFYLGHLRPLLEELKVLVKEELELSTKDERTAHIEQARKLDDILSGRLHQEKRFLADLKAIILKASVPSKEIHEEALRLVALLENILSKE